MLPDELGGTPRQGLGEDEREETEAEGSHLRGRMPAECRQKAGRKPAECRQKQQQDRKAVEEWLGREGLGEYKDDFDGEVDELLQDRFRRALAKLKAEDPRPPLAPDAPFGECPPLSPLFRRDKDGYDPDRAHRVATFRMQRRVRAEGAEAKNEAEKLYFSAMRPGDRPAASQQVQQSPTQARDPWGAEAG
eukprot:gene46829-4336_t